MASREKRPLAPSKSKQRANNNDSGLSSLSSRTKKGKALPAYILEAVATGSNKLSSKLESSLPRKKVIASLKCKKKLRATKGNLIKIKSTKNVPVKNLKRLGTQTSGKNTKTIINRTKKNKIVSEDFEEGEDFVPLNDKIPETTSIAPKSSPKSAKKLKITFLHETPLKNQTRATKYSSTSSKPNPYKNSIDLTIDEVVGMLSDSEMDDHTLDMDKLEGKLTRSKKMLLEEHEIKKEIIEAEDEKSDDDTAETSLEDQGAQYSRKKTIQRSLRNGKLRQLDLTSDLDNKRNRRSNVDDTTLAELSTETNNEAEIDCGFSSISVTAQSSIAASIIKEESVEKLDESSNTNLELENNNNSERIERIGINDDAGPILRSKTKAKSTETQLKSEDSELDDTKITTVRNIEEPKKSSSMDQLRKDCLLGKLSHDKQSPAKRRSSLNIDVKKTMGSLYGTEKTDGTTPKSHIDQMIETIKLTIAKSIESKIFGPEKALGLGKSFEASKIEEIIAPLSTETQIMVPDEQERNEDKSNVLKIETVTSNSSSEHSSSVPKVADTAKEIEKLVMGDNDTVVDTKPNSAESAGTSSASSSEAASSSLTSLLMQSDNEQTTSSECLASSSTADYCALVRPKTSRSSSSCHVNETENNSDDKVESMEVTEVSTLSRTEEAETLETISREVARLVGESAQTDKPELTIEKNINDSMKVIKNKKNKISPMGKIQVTSKDREKCLQETRSMGIDESSIDDEIECFSVRQDENNLSSSERYTHSVGKNSDIEVNELESEKSLPQMENDSELPPLQSPVNLQSDKIIDNIQNKTDVEGDEENKLKEDKKSNDENKIFLDESRRVLRTRDKQRKIEKLNKSSDVSESASKLEVENSRYDNSIDESVKTKSKSDDFVEESMWTKVDGSEHQTRTRRNRNVERLGGESSTMCIPALIEKDNDDDVKTIKSKRKRCSPLGRVPVTGKDIEEALTIMRLMELDAADIDEDNECYLLPEDNSSTSVNNEAPFKKSNERINSMESTDEPIMQVKNNTDPCIETSSSYLVGKTCHNDVEEKTVIVCEEPGVGPKNDRKLVEEVKGIADEGRRVLRTRDKQKKVEKLLRTSESRESNSKLDGCDLKSDNNLDEILESKDKNESSPVEEICVKVEEPELQTRTRRNRDVKKRKEETSPSSQSSLKSKRNRRETKKNEQQNKEETLLDNEVAKINENTRSFSTEKFPKRLEGTESLRVLSESGRGRIEKDVNRSKSENDIESATEAKSNQLARNQCGSDELKETDNPEVTSDIECKSKIAEILQKDSDEASTSGESTSSVSIKILETPEDKARKETILRLLGLESLEKAAERLHHQKVKREQYTGTLKTVIRIQKDKERDKKRSRSPLKMVLKQGRNDGEGDSPEFYTIQKELGTSGLGDSSSGANRKFSTNHRQSCDEDNEETLSKCPLIIPEKSSSFSIHPGRLCADVCCYCFGKFGSLDTPMHLAQMKSDERRKKILSVERHLTKDSCLCDACYRHVDRKANMSPTNMGPKPQRVHRQLLVSKCYVRDCRGLTRHLVKRRWLQKIKSCIQSRVNIDINWEPSQHSSMSFCVDHYGMIERFLTCSLCTRRLARNATHQLGVSETEELNRLLEQRGVPISLEAGTFVCKLCRYFTQLQLKYKETENMSTNHRSFCKSYRKRILHYNDIEASENDVDEESVQNIVNKDKRKKSKSIPSKSGSSKSPDDQSTSEKSTPELVKTELSTSSAEIETRDDHKSSDDGTTEDCPTTNVQLMDLESTVEKLKKRKALDQHLYSTDSPVFSDNGGDVVEILAMDKEVTLTRLPKRPRITNNNDITPVVQRLGANPSISVRTLFPGEEEMGLNANIEFSNVRDVTPQGWEKCATIIQYDRDTKMLWQELQRPYGNQSSFLRHLILLEKYYRSGDLVLAPNASRNAINYSTSVQNRLISYEGPEKMDEPITDTMSTEYSNSRRLSGGYLMERDRLFIPNTSTLTTFVTTTPVKSIGNQQFNTKMNPSRVLKINSGVSIIKKPPPNLQRLSLPSGTGSASATNGSAKRKDGFPSKITGGTSGGKVFQLSEPDFKRLQNLKKQKTLNEKMSTSTPISTAVTNTKSNLQYQRTQLAAQTQFQKHLRMQQEMLNRQSRGDFEPLICDVRSLANENTPAQNLLNNLNLPKSIQVTTKPANNPIPILPKIPKSLTVIPQTVSRPVDK